MFRGRNVAGIVQPEEVARVIARAAKVPRPRTRYKVGLSAHIYSGLRRVVSDRTWDWLMGLPFPMGAPQRAR